MCPKVTIIFSGGFIRPLLESDVTDDYVDALNNPEINRFLEVRKHRQTFESVLKFVKLNRESRSMILWGVWHRRKDSDRLLGTVRLHGIDTIVSTCHVGICLFEKSVMGKGLGATAIKAVTLWAFDKLLLQSIQAGVREENIGSQKAFLKAGYGNIYKIADLNVCELANSISKQYIARKEDYEKTDRFKYE